MVERSGSQARGLKFRSHATEPLTMHCPTRKRSRAQLQNCPIKKHYTTLPRSARRNESEPEYTLSPARLALLAFKIAFNPSTPWLEVLRQQVQPLNDCIRISTIALAACAMFRAFSRPLTLFEALWTSALPSAPLLSSLATFPIPLCCETSISYPSECCQAEQSSCMHHDSSEKENQMFSNKSAYWLPKYLAILLKDAEPCPYSYFIDISICFILYKE